MERGRPDTRELCMMERNKGKMGVEENNVLMDTCHTRRAEENSEPACVTVVSVHKHANEPLNS